MKPAIKDILKNQIDRALDNVANVISTSVKDYDPSWTADAPSEKSKELKAYDTYLDALVDSLTKNAPLTESTNLNEGRKKTEEDLWDQVYDNLVSDQNIDQSKLSVKGTSKNRYDPDSVEVTATGNLIVFTPSEKDFEFAKKVAKTFNLETKERKENNTNDLGKKFSIELIIPQDQVNYDKK